jgi:sulfatase maturation enzyme AslB (radical SAM superfamily)
MNKTFCILPFTHIATERNGNYLPCCGSLCTGIKKDNGTFYNVTTDSVEEAWKSEWMEDLRKDLLNGNQHSNCQRCWDAEAAGLKSRRQKSNSLISKDISTFNSTVDLPFDLDIKTGNLCNLKCITCNQLASSQHSKEVEQWKSEKVEIPSWLIKIEEWSAGRLTLESVDNVADNLSPALKKSNSIILQGGEPLINPMAIDVIDRCIEHENFDISLNIMTNMITYDQSVFDKISLFSKHSIVVSWDHVEDEKFRFIRYPGRYSQFTKNLNDLISMRTVRIGISFTASIFNIFDIEKIFDVFEDKANQINNWYEMNMQIVQGPPYFSVQYLEPEQKTSCVQMIDEFLNSKEQYVTVDDTVINQCRTLIQLLSSTPDDFNSVVKERTRVLDLYDKSRSTNWQLLFPYIKRYD